MAYVRIAARTADALSEKILRYRTGEEIKKGDRVLFHRNSGTVELVAGDLTESQATWYMQEFGGGVTIADPSVSGRTFIPAEDIPDYEDLEFVARADSK